MIISSVADNLNIDIFISIVSRIFDEYEETDLSNEDEPEYTNGSTVVSFNQETASITVLGNREFHYISEIQNLLEQEGYTCLIQRD